MSASSINRQCAHHILTGRSADACKINISQTHFIYILSIYNQIFTRAPHRCCLYTIYTLIINGSSRRRWRTTSCTGADEKCLIRSRLPKGCRREGNMCTLMRWCLYILCRISVCCAPVHYSMQRSFFMQENRCRRLELYTQCVIIIPFSKAHPE